MIRLGILIFLFGFTSILYADTLYLKNGRTMEGLIKSEDGDNLVVEVCSGSINLKRNEVEKIEKSTPDEVQAIKLKWDKQKQDSFKRLITQQMEEEASPKKIEFSADASNITLAVKLNNKVEAKLVLDTGASTVTLKMDVAKKIRNRYR